MGRERTLLFVFFCGVILASSAVGAAVPHPPKAVGEYRLRPGLSAREYQLPNGMTVVLLKNPSAPRVSVIHWVKAGSLHETPGITGIAHLFEHMMFRPLHKGAPAFDAIMKGLGAEVNANTRFLSTVFYTWVPEKNLFPALRAEADRFQRLKVTDDLLNVERKAVWSEYSTKFDSNPTVDLWESIYKLGYPKHPYGWHIIGFREDLNKINQEDCNRFFEKYYRPNNVGLFITGNIDPQATLNEVSKLYGGWKAGEASKLPEAYPATEKPVIGKGNLAAASRNILLGFRIPEYTPKSVHLLNLVNHIFYDSGYSLANRRFILNERTVSRISGFNFDYDSGLWKSFAVLLPQTSIDAFQESFLKLSDDFNNLTDDEFTILKREYFIGLSEGLLKSEALNDRMALSWGKHGGISYLVEELTHEPHVTKQEVKEFLAAYFNRKNLVTVMSQEQK